MYFFIFLSVNTNSEVRAERETRTFKIYGTVESEISSSLNKGGLQKSEFVINTEVNAKLNENLDLTALIRVRDDFNGLYNSSDNPNSSYATTHSKERLLALQLANYENFILIFYWEYKFTHRKTTSSLGSNGRIKSIGCY